MMLTILIISYFSYDEGIYSFNKNKLDSTVNNIYVFFLTANHLYIETSIPTGMYRIKLSVQYTTEKQLMWIVEEGTIW